MDSSTAKPLLEVKDLKMYFSMRKGMLRRKSGNLKAVDGVSFDINQGNILGLVGESGCGKSVTVMSLLRLIAIPPGEIVAGEARFQNHDLISIDSDEIRHVRTRARNQL